MAKKYLETKLQSDVDACNAEPYGYPSQGKALAGGIVEETQGGVGWTVGAFPVEESATGSNMVVAVDDTKVPARLVASLKSSKPATKPRIPPV